MLCTLDQGFDLGRNDAVIVEPGSVASMGLLLKELKGKTGLVLLNAWSPEVENYARGWGASLPFGTVSVDHTRLGQIQGKQVLILVDSGSSHTFVNNEVAAELEPTPAD